MCTVKITTETSVPFISETKKEDTIVRETTRWTSINTKLCDLVAKRHRDSTTANKQTGG